MVTSHHAPHHTPPATLCRPGLVTAEGTRHRWTRGKGTKSAHPSILSLHRSVLFPVLGWPFSHLTTRRILFCVFSQLCPTLCDPLDCSPPASSVHEISQARILEWVAMPSSRVVFPTQGSNHVFCVSCTGG